MAEREIRNFKRLAGLLKEGEELSSTYHISKSEAIGVASEWYDGQNSILYSLASTKEFFPEHYSDYVRDIKELINQAKIRSVVNKEDIDESDTSSLKHLLSWIERQKGGSDALASAKASMNDYQKRALDAYLDAVRWASSEEDMFKEYSNYDFAKETLEDAANDIKTFIENADGFLHGIDPEQVGHDLWLTRNGHGTGFWDRRELGDEQRAKLTELSKQMKEKWDYIGDDGKIHIQ